MTLAEQLEALNRMSLVQLKAEWRRVYKAPSPSAFTTDLLIRGIGYRLQEQALGGLAIEHRRELEQLAAQVLPGAERARAAAPSRLKPGSRLVRRWRGETYIVAVTRDGFEFQDRRYKSLSHIAQEITGTKWSGPRFFGCDK